jgi:hypothetical protein
MAVIAFFSAKGAPGVTTVAMLTASLWPRQALLVDCDPDGGDIGLRLPGEDGRPLDLERGLLTLLPRARRALEPRELLEHAQRVAGGTQVIVGLAGPEQASAGGALWMTLGQAFAGLDGYDVMVDLGRVDTKSALLPLLQLADVAVCVLGATVSSVIITRSRLRALQPALTAAGAGPRLGLIVRAGPVGADRRDVDGAAATIRAEIPDLHVLGQLATDRRGAEIFEGRPVARPERTMLVRSGTEVVARLSALVTPSWSAPTTYSPGGRP